MASIIANHPELQLVSDNIFQFLEHESWQNIVDKQKENEKNDSSGKIILILNIPGPKNSWNQTNQFHGKNVFFKYFSYMYIT